MTTNDAKSPPQSVNWGAFRAKMPAAERWAYLDHAAVGPISGPARDALADWMEDSCRNGASGYPAWVEKMEQLRTDAAAMIGATREELALVHNTTTGINLVAEGFPWKPGDNIVTRADEFPSNLYPWMQLAERGVETRQVPCDGGALDLDRLADACDDRTRIVTISWVTYSGGWRHDVDQLARMAHDQGALLFLDAIQGLGVFPLNVADTPVDFLAADGHKWLLGPEGAALFYARREHLDLLEPRGIGWNSVVDEHNFANIDLTLKDTAERYEGGSANMAGLIGFGASVELLSTFGAEAIGRRIVDVTDLACQRLEQIGAVIHTDRQPGHKSGIVVFEIPGRDPEQLRDACFERDVVLSCRGGRLRISPHAYNNTEDIERLIEGLSASPS